MKNKILFHPSSVGALLTDPKLVSDKKAGNLSTTARTLVDSIWLQNTYGYREIVTTDAMDKGTGCEADSMSLVQEVLGGPFRVKNRETMRNDYLIGTPDIIIRDAYGEPVKIEDIKTSWNLRTFKNADVSDLEMVQIQCYMKMTGAIVGSVIKCLIPTPEHLVISECEKLKWKYGGDYDNPDYIKHCEQIKKNNDVISNIPAAERVKVFPYVYDPALIELLYKRIDRAMEYYRTIKL